MANLDDVRALQALDVNHMLRFTSELPMQLREGWQNAAAVKLPAAYREVTHILILGMGGSAIGGDLLRTLVASRCPLPIDVNRGYHLPAWVGPQTLVIASSHSGNTEETLSALSEARTKNFPLAAITTGGELAARASAWGIPLIQYRYPSQPRAALGYSFTSLLAILVRLGFVPDPAQELEEAITILTTQRSTMTENVPQAGNPARQLAAQLVGCLPVIIGAGVLGVVARRWASQMNENSKTWAYWQELPEADHNAIVGNRFPADGIGRLSAIFLTTPDEKPRLALRRKATADLFMGAGINSRTISAQGMSPLARMFSLISLGDYVSCYLGLAQDADPTDITPITRLKMILAAAGK
jgi:glucose/mannose-6-phosphate isomerase